MTCKQQFWRRLPWPSALAATIAWASRTPGPQIPAATWLPAPDKLGHLLLFGLLASLILRLRASPSLPWTLSAITLTCAFGLADELHQLSNPQRTFEWADLAANALGACLAATLYARWPRYRQLLEFPLRRLPGTRIFANLFP